LVTCWQYGFGAINTAHALASAGLEPVRLYSMVLDELWEALRVGHGMPGRVDALTRTNRTEGVGVTMITHSLADVRALKSEEDRQMARGLAERAGIVVLGGLPKSEMAMLQEVVGLSGAEQDLLTSWQDPPAWDAARGQEADPPGRGCFLVKVGGGQRPGIPLHLPLTSVERNLHNTSKLWEKVEQVGTVADLPPADPGIEPVEEVTGVPPVPPVRLSGPPVPPPMTADEWRDRFWAENGGEEERQRVRVALDRSRAFDGLPTPTGELVTRDHEVAAALALWETDPVAAERMLAELAERREAAR
jgi:hypothetical protein